MVKMPQVKIPVKTILKVLPGQCSRHGTITNEEKELILQAASKSLGIPAGEVRNFVVRKKSLDARKKNNQENLFQIVRMKNIPEVFLHLVIT